MSDHTTWDEEHKNPKHGKFLELLGNKLTPHRNFTFELPEKALVDFRWLDCSLPFWPPSNKHIIKLGRMYVPDDFRGNGFGEEILQIVKTVAKKANIIVLLRANGFFWREKHSFSPFGYEPPGIKFPVHFESVKEVLPYWHNVPPETNDHKYIGWELNRPLREWYLSQDFLYLYDGGCGCLNTDHRYPNRSDVMVYIPKKMKIPEQVKTRVHNR